MKALSIAFLTADNPRDKRSWSGTLYFLLKEIEKSGEVEVYHSYTPQPLRFLCSAFNFLTLRLFHKRFDYRHSRIMRKALGKEYSKYLKQNDYDLAIVVGSTSIAAGINTKIPVIYINDRVIQGAMDYHKVLTGLFDFSRQQSIETDRLAIEKSTLSVFSSEWAAGAAKKNHSEITSKIKMLPFGANLDVIPGTPAEKVFPEFPLQLFFAGVHWEDKGGPAALETLQHLISKGIDAELIVCGCIPPVIHPKMKVIGFLNKNNPQEFEKLNGFFRTSDFFILPTKYEAYGLVFCESAAYGLPALAPATGGITTIIEDGVTGFLLPVDANGKEYAEKIISLINAPEKYSAMRNAAYARFKNKLNWESWAEGFKKILEESGIGSK
ncbi:MAG: glycosyltransferase family 4 protein [Bacteroidota bacterium]|nr:glycosyltransferase family 4 protein [Bacteroidota bacterium]